MGDTNALDIEASEMFDNLKVKTQDKLNQQHPILVGKLSENGRMFSDYNTLKETILYLVRSLRGGTQIIMKTHSDDTVALDVESNANYDNRKAEIQSKLDQQRPIFVGKQVEDRRVLPDFNLLKETVLHQHTDFHEGAHGRHHSARTYLRTSSSTDCDHHPSDGS